MDIPLEETMKRMDYKLKYRFNYCGICESRGMNPNRMTNIYVHDFDGDGYNINQYHGQLGTKECHIEKPIKFCTKCKKLYNYTVTKCEKCQPLVDSITELELIIEESTKLISKTQRLRSSGKYSPEEAKTRIQELEETIKESKMELGRLI